MTDLTKVILMISTAVVAMTLLVFAKEHVKYVNMDRQMPVGLRPVVQKGAAALR